MPCDVESTDGDSPLASRVRQLEERLAFAERTVEELNDVVLAQQVRLERVERELAEGRAALERVVQSGTAGENLPYEKPPHY